MASDDDAEIQRYKNSRRMGLTPVRLRLNTSIEWRANQCTSTPYEQFSP